jgi:hypothetical protein
MDLLSISIGVATPHDVVKDLQKARENGETVMLNG